MATAQKSAAASHVADLRTGYGWRRGLRVRSSKYLEALQRAAQMAFHPSSSPGEGYPIWQEDVGPAQAGHCHRAVGSHRRKNGEALHMHPEPRYHVCFRADEHRPESTCHRSQQCAVIAAKSLSLKRSPSHF
jgi:hypothetical protein